VVIEQKHADMCPRPAYRSRARFLHLRLPLL
jgi:hypothetical protein